MATYRNRFGPHNPDETYIAHELPEQLVDLGEVQMNYVAVGDPSRAGAAADPRPDRVVVGVRAGAAAARRALPGVRRRPARAGPLDAARPGRYTLDNMGNDLVRFIDLVIGRPTIVSGLSSGGVLAAWLSAYAKPGQIVAAALRGSAALRLAGRTGRRAGHPPGHRRRLPPVEHLPRRPVEHRRLGRACSPPRPTSLPAVARPASFPMPAEPPQNLKEYDPEWGRAFWTGTRRRLAATTTGCCASVRVPGAVHPPLPARSTRPTGPAHRCVVGRPGRPGPGARHGGGRDGRLPVVRGDGTLHARPGPPAVRRHARRLVRRPARVRTSARRRSWRMQRTSL